MKTIINAVILVGVVGALAYYSGILKIEIKDTKKA